MADSRPAKSQANPWMLQWPKDQTGDVRVSTQAGRARHLPAWLVSGKNAASVDFDAARLIGSGLAPGTTAQLRQLSRHGHCPDDKVTCAAFPASFPDKDALLIGTGRRAPADAEKTALANWPRNPRSLLG